MLRSRPARFGALLLVSCLGVAGLRAQTTDGYHAIQVFPIVVDSGSFVQRFNIHNNNEHELSLKVKYFPAIGVAGAPIDCPNMWVPLGGERVMGSLREMCPAIPAGTQFGFVMLYDNSVVNNGYNTFSAFSRVSNIAGAGFTVEGFAATTFSSGESTITGLRRLAATPNSPAFQTNCFFGSLNLFDPPPGVQPAVINYNLYDHTFALIGSGQVTVGPGQMIRILDIFSHAGVAASDVNDAVLRLGRISGGNPGLMSFCTVQDNTSFGADFRIAKVSAGHVPGYPGVEIASQDLLAMREVWLDQDSLGRPFEIPAGQHSNTHVFYFRQPDAGMCELINPATGVRALPSYGLEMRSIHKDGSAGGGGNNNVAFPGSGSSFVSGDKNDGDSGHGANTRALIEIEDAETNSGVNRPYVIHCRFGSGATGFDMLRYKEPVGRF